MALTTTDGLVTAMPGQHRHFQKLSTTAKAAGAYQSLWTAAGRPGAAAYPGASLAWSVMTEASAGAVDFTNPGGALLSYLGRFAASATIAGTLILYDRLAQTGAITPAASTQTLTGGPTLTRPDANGGDVECWIESISASGATASNYSIRYVDQTGNTSETSPVIPATATSVAGMMQPFNLNTGDTGVRSVDQFISTGASGGTAQLVLLRRIAEFPIALANAPQPPLDFFALGGPQIYDDACLAFMWLPAATTATTFTGAVSIIGG